MLATLEVPRAMRLRVGTDPQAIVEAEAEVAGAEELMRWRNWIAAEAAAEEERDHSRAVDEILARSPAACDRAAECAGETGERALRRLRGVRPPENRRGAHGQCVAAFGAYLDTLTEHRRAAGEREPREAAEAWDGVLRHQRAVVEALRAVSPPAG